MEDWLLHIRADGRGHLWYGNLMGAHVAVFDWRLTDGRLTTSTRRQFQTPPGSQEPVRAGGHVRLGLVQVAVTVGVEPNPARRQLRVLRLPPGPPAVCSALTFSFPRHGGLRCGEHVAEASTSC